MSVLVLSSWPHRIWQEQIQAGVTANIHLPVNINGGGAVFVQGHTCTVHTNKQAHAFKHMWTQLKEYKRASRQASMWVFPGRSYFVMLASLKCLQALMSYYGRQMATEAASPLIHSGHDSYVCMWNVWGWGGCLQTFGMHIMTPLFKRHNRWTGLSEFAVITSSFIVDVFQFHSRNMRTHWGHPFSPNFFRNICNDDEVHVYATRPNNKVIS